MEDQQHNPLRDQILDTIKNGQAKMKPKWYFIFRAALFLTGCIFVFLLLLYLVSLGLFVLDEHELWAVPSFGFRGIMLFLTSLPWLLIAFVLIFLLVLQVLVRHYSFAYHRSLFYSALGVLGIVIVGSIIIRQVGFHQTFSEYSLRNHIPLAEPFYERFELDEDNGVYPGTISEMQEKAFLLKNRSEHILEVHIMPNTRLPQGIDFVVGDQVIVVGDKDNDVIEAYGIRKLPPRPLRGPMKTMRPLAPEHD